MNQIKIGKFIAETRKEQGMTQRQLAECLNISDRTVSKWECGNGMPDNAILLELCNALKISVNELLSGERLSSDTYHEKAEENMIQLIHKSKNEERGRKWSVIALLAETYFIILMVILSSGGMAGIVNFLDLPSFLAVLSITFFILTLSGANCDFFRAVCMVFQRKKEWTETELRQSLHATRLVLICCPLSGLFFTLLSIITVLDAGLENHIILANLAVACISTLYGLILDFLLLPIAVRLHKLIR